jgi:hypothetical protein
MGIAALNPSYGLTRDPGMTVSRLLRGACHRPRIRATSQ